MLINRKCGRACVIYHLSALKPLRSFGPTQRSPTIGLTYLTQELKTFFTARPVMVYPNSPLVFNCSYVFHQILRRKGGRVEGRESGREGGREGVSEGGREGVSEGVREGRVGVREGEREGEREGGKE